MEKLKLEEAVGRFAEIKAQLLVLDEVRSTNTFLHERMHDLHHLTVVAAHRQTAGRGQRGNSWESAPEANMVTSILLKHDHEKHLAMPFDLSVVTSLAILDLLRPLLPQEKVLTIKWPNDIYVDDKKICGILIENEWLGNRLEASILGIGLNVNQSEFLSDAPNPTSLLTETGREWSVVDLLFDLTHRISELYVKMCVVPEELRHLYNTRLYRLGWESGRYREGDRLFEARLIGVAPDGNILLRELSSGRTLSFAFKEVAFVID